jgi:hypothetical protein
MRKLAKRSPVNPTNHEGLPRDGTNGGLYKPTERAFFHGNLFIGIAYAFGFERQTTFKMLVGRVECQVKFATYCAKNLGRLIGCDVSSADVCIIFAEDMQPCLHAVLDKQRNTVLLGWE